MKRLNSELCILYTENTVRVWPDKSGVTLVVQRDYKLRSTKKNPVASCETTGLNLVAWTGIEPVTRGFSTPTTNLRVQYFQRVVT